MNYVGSVINIFSYNNDYLTFKSSNYYCDNGEYVGLLEKEPTCNYKYNITYFKVQEENNNLRIANYEEILKIIE